MKALIYTRVSKLEAFQNIERQLKALKEYASLCGYEIIEEVSENISGRRIKREGTSKLIELAKLRKISKVLIHEVSRLGRNHVDSINTVEELKKYKVSVFDFDQKQETLDENGNYNIFGTIITPLLAGIAAREVEQSSYRIKSGLALAKSKGVKLGRPKNEKIKKQDDIIKLLNEGIIQTDIGKIIKASNRNIAKYLGVAVGTVKKVKNKKIKINLTLEEA